MNQELVQVDIDTIKKVMEEEYNNDHEKLIMILQDINGLYNYLPLEALELVADRLGIPESEVHAVSSFYKAFSLTPRGKHIINICLGTACHVRGAERILESIEERLDISEGGTTEDMQFSLESVRCLGCCALGPVIAIGDKLCGGLDRKKIHEVIDKYETS